MTREEAIAIFKGFKFLPREMKAIDMAIKALEQEPNTKNDLGVDCISRKAVLDLPKRTMRNYFGEITAEVIDVKDIMKLPLVTPQEPKIGNWIDREVYDADRWKCSECGRTEQYKENYCPNCGSKMVEP